MRPLQSLDLDHIHYCFNIVLLNVYHENTQHWCQQHPYSESGRVNDDRHEVEKALYFSFSHSGTEPLYQISCSEYLPRQDQWIHSDEIDEDFTFRLWQEVDLTTTFQRKSCHSGRTEPRKRSGRLYDIQGEMDRVMRSIMRTSTVRVEQPLADKWERATEVVQGLERAGKHFHMYKKKETERCRVSWQPL